MNLLTDCLSISHYMHRSSLWNFSFGRLVLSGKINTKFCLVLKLKLRLKIYLMALSGWCWALLFEF